MWKKTGLMTGALAAFVLGVLAVGLLTAPIHGGSVPAGAAWSLVPGERLDVSCDGDLYMVRRSGSEVGLACGWPASTPPPTLTPTPVPTPMAARPFGPFNFPPSEAESWPFTASRLGRSIGDLEAARVAGLRVLVALTGGRSGYTDGDGCFNLGMWRAALDRNDLAAIQPYVNDGTIAGLYAIDEPHDWDCGPTYVELNEVCRYANERLPGIRCGFNAPPAWLAEGLGETDFDQLGYLFTQTNFQRTSDWPAWAERQIDETAWFDGPLWLSMNVVTGNPSVEQIQNAGVALCQAGDGVMMWRWPTGFDRPGTAEAMQAVAIACGWEE